MSHREELQVVSHNISRRTLLTGTAAAGALSLTGLPARADINWKKYSGTKLEVILAKGPRGDNLQKYIKEFTELSGIQVESEQIPEQQQRQKVVIELTSGRPSFDVVHISYHVQKRQFEKAGWLADMTPYLKDPTLTPPDLVESDFSAAGLQYARNDKGQMLSLPWSVDYFILYYNKELFQKKGVEVPKTLEEMAVAAEKLTDPKEGVYGFVGRGLRNANMAMWTNFYLNYGGEFLDAKGNILSDGPEAIEATKLYQRLLTKSAPPGVAGFNWMESMASFTQGRAAMWIDADGWAPPLEDPAASRVVGKVGYTRVPAGPKGQFSSTYGDGIGIAAASKNKEAAYLLCQWVASKGQGTRLLQAGGGVPFRNSIVDDPEVAKGVKTKEWLQSVIDSAKISKLGLPVIIPVAEYRDTVGAALTATLSGADPATELKKAHEQFRPILERSEKA
ncbi:extracellular solute-binding protein [Bradyrhizobium sp. BR 10289]|uniref:ABC transporter substrate-binding protein n=1 Tax=Bradyrhizobium sp. BR 10289 TaxID=2749993 RepID=UPI001C6511FF|nr:extracellular solute-binding protein [Bradyrhizobium sp. BR 10289]MBW7972619.1 extracellular solute-binding protein [Bradyrhizobium sp. BR 10289]